MSWVIERHGTPKGAWCRSCSQVSVDRLESQTDHVRGGMLPVPVTGVMPSGRTVATYDITVADAHRFTAEGLVVHNSAELALGSSDDLAFIGMKLDQDKLMSHRWASNNSIAIDSEFEDFERIAAAIVANGEPGIVNLELQRTRGRLADEGPSDERNRDIIGTNPCGEIGLASGEACCLAEVFPAVCMDEGIDVERALRLALRYAKRVTFADLSWRISRDIMARNHRVGVSLSGIRDWMLKLGVRDGEELAPLLDHYYRIVRDEDESYSRALGCPTSVAVTTVKPSGTISLISNASPGLHAHYAPYYIRRIRFQDSDPLIDIIRECGFHVEPDAYSPNTVVAEFPVKAPGADRDDFRCAGDLSLEEQFAMQAALQRWWADNSVSATLTFRKNERRRIPRLLREYRDRLKSTSLLPYAAEEAYAQVPYEPISKERYEQMISRIAAWPHEMAERLDERHGKEFDIVEQSDCAGGACPIR